MVLRDARECQFQITLYEQTSNGVKHLKRSIILMIKNN